MKRLFGGILLALGVLIAGASGLCSLAVLVIGAGGKDDYISMIPLVSLFGGIPFLIGVGLFYVGRLLIRSDRD